MRHLELELLILTGPEAGRRLQLGSVAAVLGRSGQVPLSFPQDRFLSGAHVQFVPEFEGIRVTDLGSTNGTFVNERPIGEVVAFPGDVLRAGGMQLRVVPALVNAPEGKPIVSSQQPGLTGLADELTGGQASLFLVIDAAADPEVAEQLRAAQGVMVQSLYEGSGAQELAPWAPYLVSLSAQPQLVSEFLGKGWGKGWMTFCTVDAPFGELRRHLRRFLMVQLEGGPQAYFRFYDPRVLRDFLPTATYPELLQFFGPIQEWLMEGASPGTLLRSRCSAEGLATVAVPVHL